MKKIMLYKNSFEFFKSIYEKDTAAELFKLFKSTKKNVLKQQRENGRYKWIKARAVVLDEYKNIVFNNYELFQILVNEILLYKTIAAGYNVETLEAITYNEQVSIAIVLNTISKMHSQLEALKAERLNNEK